MCALYICEVYINRHFALEKLEITSNARFKCDSYLGYMCKYYIFRICINDFIYASWIGISPQTNKARFLLQPYRIKTYSVSLFCEHSASGRTSDMDSGQNKMGVVKTRNAGISRNFAEYHGISRNITEFRGISRNFAVHVECALVLPLCFGYFSLTGTVSTSPNLAKARARWASNDCRATGSLFS